MRQITIFIPAVLCVIIQILTASCSHKTIDDPGLPSVIEVRFEWDHTLEANVEGMSLYFYPLDDYNRIWRFDIAGRDGGRVELPSGCYRMIACNNDLSGVVIDGTGSPTTIQASAARMIDKDVYASTGMLYGTVVSRLEVSPCCVRYSTSEGTIKQCCKGVVRSHPDSLTTQYTINIRHVTGLEQVRTVAAELNPVASAILLDSRKPVNVGAWLYMPFSVDRQRQCMTGSGYAFGPPAAIGRLTMLIARADGKTVARTIEITPENTNIISSHNVLITIDSLEIPDEDSDDDVGGIEAAVDGWTIVEIDLEPTM